MAQVSYIEFWRWKQLVSVLSHGFVARTSEAGFYQNLKKKVIVTLCHWHRPARKDRNGRLRSWKSFKTFFLLVEPIWFCVDFSRFLIFLKMYDVLDVFSHCVLLKLAAIQRVITGIQVRRMRYQKLYFALFGQKGYFFLSGEIPENSDGIPLHVLNSGWMTINSLFKSILFSK